jgi:hypothetical protein
MSYVDSIHKPSQLEIHRHCSGCFSPNGWVYGIVLWQTIAQIKATIPAFVQKHKTKYYFSALFQVLAEESYQFVTQCKIFDS